MRPRMRGKRVLPGVRPEALHLVAAASPASASPRETRARSTWPFHALGPFRMTERADGRGDRAGSSRVRRRAGVSLAGHPVEGGTLAQRGQVCTLSSNHPADASQNRVRGTGSRR